MQTNHAHDLRTLSAALTEFEHEGQIIIMADMIQVMCDKFEAIAERLDQLAQHPTT